MSVKPLERYVRLLEVVSGFPEGISPATIAEMLDLPKATAYRLIRSLAEVDLVEMTAPQSASCRLGQRLEKLLFAAVNDGWLQMVSRPVLFELTDKTSEASFLVRFRGDTVRSVGMVAPNNQLRAYILPGQYIPLHAGASAKAILAFQEEDVIKSLLGGDLRRFTVNTKIKLESLLEEFAEIRKNGIAYCIGEDVDGFAGVAAPIFVPGMPEPQFSVCLTGTINALIGAKKDLIEAALKASAKHLALILAHRPEFDGQCMGIIQEITEATS